ncbi:MAG: thioredoxin family protein [Bradymonadaceae bacterium]
MAQSPVAELSTASFETEVLESQQPTIVFASAGWNGPAELTATTVEALAGEFESEVKTVRVDVDRAPELAANYSIDAVPAFLLFVDGEVVDRRHGALTHDELEELYRRGL